MMTVRSPKKMEDLKREFGDVTAKQVSALSDAELVIYAEALTAMLAACKIEFDRRRLADARPTGTA